MSQESAMLSDLANEYATGEIDLNEYEQRAESIISGGSDPQSGDDSDGAVDVSDIPNPDEITGVTHTRQNLPCPYCLDAERDVHLSATVDGRDVTLLACLPCLWDVGVHPYRSR